MLDALIVLQKFEVSESRIYLQISNSAIRNRIMLGLFKKKISAEEASDIVMNDFIKHAAENYDEFCADFKDILSKLSTLSGMKDIDQQSIFDIMLSDRSFKIYYCTLFALSALPARNIFRDNRAKRIEDRLFKVANTVFSGNDSWMYKYMSDVYNYLKSDEMRIVNAEYMNIFIKNVYSQSPLKDNISFLTNPVATTMIDGAFMRSVFIRYWSIINEKNKIV